MSNEIMTLSEARAAGLCVDYPANPRGEGAPYYDAFDNLIGYRKFSGVKPHPKGGLLIRADGRGFVPAPATVKVLVDLEDGPYSGHGTVIALEDDIESVRDDINRGNLGPLPSLRVWRIAAAVKVGDVVVLP